jgi:dipeptidyl aminopeptidase/acylaminoacyl peptidase
VPSAPVLLLHGADDNVIPAAESRWLGEHLRRLGTPARVLVTPLITHAEIDRPPSPREVLQMVRFWMELVSG